MKVTIVLFNVTKDAVLMVKPNMANDTLLKYPSVDIKSGVYYMTAGYDLLNNLDLTKKDVNLHFVRHEKVLSKCPDYAEEDWNTCILGGILGKEISISDDYIWVNTKDTTTLCDADGFGACLMHMLEAEKVLKIS